MSSIGFFQFDNLIRNRVPFCLLNFSDSQTSLYTSIYKLHLENWESLVNLENYQQVLAEKNLPKDFAIVTLCLDGSLSAQARDVLLSLGYGNVYWCEGGTKDWPKKAE